MLRHVPRTTIHAEICEQEFVNDRKFFHKIRIQHPKLQVPDVAPLITIPIIF